ncbi:parvalbumin-7 [Scomber scombrus]|uniref:Parvalbumin n=1 Tax=Scomber scombrus TaxID=13677 RepID=A0AAV1Q134_SCOSC
MSMTDLLKAEEIKKALDAFAGLFVLKGFSKEGRDLTDAETSAFLNAADKDGDGKIGIDEFEGLVHE